MAKNNLDISTLRQRAQRAAAIGGVVAVDSATLLRLLDGYAESGETIRPPADVLDVVYHALLDIVAPQVTMRQLNSGRVVLLSDPVWDKINAAIQLLSRFMEN
ncbi:MAG: hypothetical protein JXA21_24170 [Anaerolineae bacterium]|nr:hypothetical protein [Anaerolineae bacterium]